MRTSKYAGVGILALLALFGCHAGNGAHVQKAARTTEAHQTRSVIHYAFPDQWTAEERQSVLKDSGTYQEVLSHDHMITWGYCRFEIAASTWDAFVRKLDSPVTSQKALPGDRETSSVPGQIFTKLSGKAMAEDGEFYVVPWWTPEKYDGAYCYWCFQIPQRPFRRVVCKVCPGSKGTLQIFMATSQE